MGNHSVQRSHKKSGWTLRSAATTSGPLKPTVSLQIYVRKLHTVPETVLLRADAVQ